MFLIVALLLFSPLHDGTVVLNLVVCIWETNTEIDGDKIIEASASADPYCCNISGNEGHIVTAYLPIVTSQPVSWCLTGILGLHYLPIVYILFR